MSIHNIPNPKKSWKMTNPGGWLLGLIIVGIISRCILTFLSVRLPESVIYSVYLVNRFSYLGLLIGLILYVCQSFMFMKKYAKRLALSNIVLDDRFIRELKRQFVANNNLVQESKDRKRWLLTSKGTFQNHQGEIRGFGGITHNTSECEQADEKLCHLGIAVETMQLGMTITDIGGKIIYTNPAEARMHGYEVDDLIGKDLGVFAPAKLRKPMTLEQIKRMKRLRESINIRKDGSIFPVRLISGVIEDTGGQPVAIVTTCEDITERKRTEEAFKQRTRELALLNRMSDLLQACRNEEETYRVVGRVCKKLFPLDSGCLCIMDRLQTRLKVVELWGNPLHSKSEIKIETPNTSSLLCPRLNFCPDQDCLCAPISASEEILGLLSLCFRQGKSSDSDNNGDPNTIKAKQMALTRVAEHYAVSLVNLRLRETLRMECIRDPLTGLYNRRYMEESLQREARRAKRHNTSIGIIMLDIDHFKNFNDIYGHEAGDIVLKRLGSFLQRHTRGEDIACRYGGEEFLLILPETPLEVVVQRAKELHLGVKEFRIIYQGKPLQITISAGVAVMPEHSFNVKEVVKAADTALYQAKENGRDQVMVALS